MVSGTSVYRVKVLPILFITYATLLRGGESEHDFDTISLFAIGTLNTSIK